MANDYSTAWFMLICTLLAGAAGFWVWSAVRQRLLYDLHKIPGPPGWPILGNIPEMITMPALQSHQVSAAYVRKYGLVYKLRIGPSALLVAADPEEVAKLTSNSNRLDNLPKLTEAYQILEARAPHYSLFGTPDAEEWKSFRKTLNPAFSPDNIRKVYPKIYHIVLHASDVLQQLCQQGPVDISQLSARLTAEVIGNFAFDEELHGLQLDKTADGSLHLAPQPFVQATRAQLDWIALISSNPLQALLYALLPFLPAARKAKASIKAVRQKEDSMAHEFRRRGLQSSDNTSLWACFGRLVNYKDGTPASHDSLAMNIGFFFTAGYETTAHLINWALFELAASPAIQAQLRQELETAGLMPTALQSETRKLEFADLTKLPLLDAIVRETLRMHATAPNGTFRKANKDMIIGGFRVPKGTPVQLPVYPMHLSPDNYVQPHTFWPERWMQPEGSFTPTDPEHPDATPIGNRRNQATSWNPFSCGPRNCIGQTLALAEARTTLAVFVARFQFELPDGTDQEAFLRTEQVSRLTLQPREALLLNITPISRG